MTQQFTLKSGAANRSPAGETLKGAVIATIVTIILTAPILGLQLKLDGYKVVLEQHWRPVWIAAAIVFVFQLIKPMLVRSRRAIKLPAVPAMGRRQQLTAMWVLLAVGLVWPQAPQARPRGDPRRLPSDRLRGQRRRRSWRVHRLGAHVGQALPRRRDEPARGRRRAPHVLPFS